VIDQTGLTGEYAVQLTWWKPGPVDASANAEPDGRRAPTIQKALEDQLGLTIQSKKVPVDVIAIDHVEKMPRND
jgi:uncharacterized protein (TIGR03435 family)